MFTEPIPLRSEGGRREGCSLKARVPLARAQVSGLSRQKKAERRLQNVMIWAKGRLGMVTDGDATERQHPHRQISALCQLPAASRPSETLSGAAHTHICAFGTWVVRTSPQTVSTEWPRYSKFQGPSNRFPLIPVEFLAYYPYNSLELRYPTGAQIKHGSHGIVTEKRCKLAG